MHSWYAAQARLFVFADSPGGRVQGTLYSANTYGDAGGSGVLTIHVNNGYQWGFIIQGTNFDSTRLLYGDLTIDTFNVIKELTVTGISSDNKMYDGTTGAGLQIDSPGLIGVEPGDDVSLLMSNPSGTFNDRNIGTGKPITVSGLSLGGDDASGYYINPIITADIAPLPIIVTAVPDTKTYDGTTLSNATPSLSIPLAAGDMNDSFIQTFDNRNAGAVKSLTPSGIVNDGNGGRNYAYTFIDATGGITKLPITVSSLTDTKTYDGTVSSSKIPSLSIGLATGDTTHSFRQIFDDRNAGTGKTLIPAGAVNDGNNGNNYDATFISAATGEIQKLPVTISAVADFKTYDGRVLSSGIPTLSAPAMEGDTPAFSQTFDNRNVGTCKKLTPAGVIADGNNGANYSYTFLSVTSGQIDKLAITIIASPDRKMYDGTGFSSAAPSVFPGLAQGDSDSFTQQFADKNAGTNKTIFASGRVDDGNDGENYSYTYRNDTTGVVDKLPISIFAVPDSKVYDGTNTSSATPKTSQPVSVGDIWSFKQSYDNRNAGAAKTLTPFGAVVDGNGGANYACTFISVSTGEIIKKPVSVAAVSDSKTYDGTTSSTGNPLVLTDLGFGDSEYKFNQNFDNKNAGTGKQLIPSGVILDGNDGKNYDYSFFSAEGWILPKPVTVIGVAAQNKTFDGTTDCKVDVSTATLSGLVGSDAASLVTFEVAGSFDNSEVGVGKSVVISGLSLTGLDANNYVCIPPALNADILEKPRQGVVNSIFAVLGTGIVLGGFVMFWRRRKQRVI
ncbi:YDG domain-containing protein [Dehalogenimonas etheniformans]|uniref:YDG domain-containing protein n=1 Tax=Dehalogenimonas etheniformans TaxID=1536648 RepID=A0A2P5P8F3_9CHLR|nr:YDG domain-containing protein [Dehalogenimonas etheniformans]PPD58582.1 hypothetical protein JP09_001480 [Dehalogenimonas etheniformans]QNT76654.1 hypothetical protein HX448_08140 [Dehalogenimonas etheniformans]